ncbi:hypothetical protein KAR91_69365 [Candidatus Pacearchaeota archaeon]|nr:hypothetical protein [Candidatus Pacearchaeota archaeon]
MNTDLAQPLITLREKVLEQKVVPIFRTLILRAFGLDTPTYNLYQVGAFVDRFRLAKEVFIGQNRICGNPKFIHSVDVAIYVKQTIDDLLHQGPLFNPIPYFNVAISHDILEDDTRGHRFVLSSMVRTGNLAVDEYLAIRTLSKNDEIFHPDYDQSIVFSDDPEGYLGNYESYLRNSTDHGIVEACLREANRDSITNFPLPTEVDVERVDFAYVILLGSTAKMADGIDNIWTATTLRNSIYGPLRASKDSEPPYVWEMHLVDYIKQIRKTRVALEVFSEHSSNYEPDGLDHKLSISMLSQLNVGLIFELQQEIERTDIELDSSKDHVEKIEALRELIPDDPRLNIVKNRYDLARWYIESEPRSRTYLTPKLTDRLQQHRSEVVDVRNKLLLYTPK